MKKNIQSLENKTQSSEFIVYGFDLFFDEFSVEKLSTIANDVGDTVKVNFDLGLITYLFTQDRYVKVTEIPNLHETLEEAGLMLASKHKCKFVRSECYMRAPIDVLKAFTNENNIGKINTNQIH